jgi:uncharacterized membrane protein
MQIAKAFLIGGTAGLAIGLLGHGLKNLLRGNHNLTVIIATALGALGVIAGVFFVLRLKAASVKNTSTPPAS